ncbi:CaiB/BaiF CoA-transferase family protein [Arthrobacter sp. ISL-95]|uniref:CaiB/BaiF CoA transferase family protein n=1 Tax=Arthrobacter sp. ISL-95 TaxID=2819116 RepID=UPI001BEADF5D|nr:CaiB/BaiF CoA-transferase family protein [Arthrobacter sp. ISL-95]MBT2588427.1 CoA transferase [Arthrobacter sp. ISL-95]
MKGTDTVKPLSGVTVIDLTQLMAGPSATMLLGDMGADVIKIEQLEGELSRRLGTSVKSLFLANNRNKRSMAMDLKHPQAREIVRELVARSDIFVQGFSPGAMDRLGLGYEDLIKVQPRLVYASLSGFGTSDTGTSRKGVDAVVQAETGIMAATGELDGSPMKVGFQVVDAAAGLALAQGILASLRLRDMTGEPQYLSTSLYQVSAFLQGHYFVEASITGGEVSRIGNTGGTLAYPTDLFVTSDRGYVQVAAYLPEQWRLLCATIERADLVADPRFADVSARVQNQALLRTELQNAFSTRSRDEWTSRFRASGVVAGPVLSHGEVMRSDEASRTNCFVDGEFDGQAYKSVRIPITSAPYEQSPVSAPRLGADTDAILADLGYTEEQILALSEAGTTPAR